MVKKTGKNEWTLFSKDGSKVLGKHRSRADAKRQEIAISISKARKAGHKIARK